jgi:predicted alpha/beta hydrolase family esterase
VLLLHGWQNRRPPDHWQFWLAERIRERGEQVLYPQLPNPDEPQLDEWVEALSGELAQLGAGERVVICHSLSCLLWAHAAPRLGAKARVDRLLWVAPPGPSAFVREIATFAPDGLDPEAVQATAPLRQLVCADNDPYCPEQADLVYGSLGFDATVLSGAGHLDPEAGLGPWPAVDEWVRGDTGAFRLQSSRS